MSSISKLRDEVFDAIRQLLAERIAPEDPGAALAIGFDGEPAWAMARGVADLDNHVSLITQTQLDTGSVMKTLTGTAIALLEEEGALSTEGLLQDILPEFPGYGRALRLKHLLHHESGLRNYTVLMYYMAGWHEMAPPSADEVYQTICRAGSLGFQPGEEYEYCDTNYFLLARVVERITGDRFGAFIADRILGPMGLGESTILDCVDADKQNWAEGYVNYPSQLQSPYVYRTKRSLSFTPSRLAYRHVGAEGWRTSVNDLLTLGVHLIGPSDVLSDAIRERMLRISRLRKDGFGYGYGLNVGTYRGMRYFGHSGEIQGFTATLACFPDDKLCIASLTNRQDLTAWALRDWVLDRLHERPLSRDSMDKQLKPKAVGIDALKGAYLHPITSRFLHLADCDGGVCLAMNGGEPLPLRGDGPWQTDAGTLLIPKHRKADRASLIVQSHDVASEYIPFLLPGDYDDFSEYAGTYCCEALDTTFHVDATTRGIRLTNDDPRRCSMNLDYTPTVRDFFWSHDPHPGISQIQFLRDDECVAAWVYRDCDGDRREDFRFVQESRLR